MNDSEQRKTLYRLVIVCYGLNLENSNNNKTKLDIVAHTASDNWMRRVT